MMTVLLMKYAIKIYTNLHHVIISLYHNYSCLSLGKKSSSVCGPIAREDRESSLGRIQGCEVIEAPSQKRYSYGNVPRSLSERSEKEST
jgi:hypothetical protein